MKKWLLIGSIGIIGLLTMAGDSVYRKYKEFFDKMTYLIGTISGVDISLQRIKFNIQPVIKNNTHHQISISTFGFASIEKIEVRDKLDKTVATAYLNLDTFEINSYEAMSFPKVPIEIPLTQAILNVININFSNLTFESVLTHFRFIMHVQVAGKKMEYQLNL